LPRRTIPLRSSAISLLAGPFADTGRSSATGTLRSRTKTVSPWRTYSRQRLSWFFSSDTLACFHVATIATSGPSVKQTGLRQASVLKEGAVLFVRDEDALYALAIRTARAFEDFRHIDRPGRA